MSVTAPIVRPGDIVLSTCSNLPAEMRGTEPLTVLGGPGPDGLIQVQHYPTGQTFGIGPESIMESGQSTEDGGQMPAQQPEMQAGPIPALQDQESKTYILTKKDGTKKEFQAYLSPDGFLVDRLYKKVGTKTEYKKVLDQEAYEDGYTSYVTKSKVVDDMRPYYIPYFDGDLIVKDGKKDAIHNLRKSNPSTLSVFKPYEKYMLKVGENIGGVTVTPKPAKPKAESPSKPFYIPSAELIAKEAADIQAALEEQQASSQQPAAVSPVSTGTDAGLVIADPYGETGDTAPSADTALSGVSATETQPAQTPDSPKEPWQMTFEEYLISLLIANDYKFKFVGEKSFGTPGYDDVLALHTPADNKNASQFEKTLRFSLIPNRAKGETLHSKYTLKYEDVGLVPHIAHVRQALAEGKPVPAEVLALYPELVVSSQPAPVPVVETGDTAPSADTAQSGVSATETQPAQTPDSPKRPMLQYPTIPATVRAFMPLHQQKTVRANIKEYQDVLARLEAQIAALPETYGTQSNPDPVAYLHYFSGGSDWYITEKDAGDPDDPATDTGVPAQQQAFGLVAFAGNEPEKGYISIEEMVNMEPSTTRTGTNQYRVAMVELDFFWDPKTLSEIQRKTEEREQKTDNSLLDRDDRKAQIEVDFALQDAAKLWDKMTAEIASGDIRAAELVAERWIARIAYDQVYAVTIVGKTYDALKTKDGNYLVAWKGIVPADAIDDVTEMADKPTLELYDNLAHIIVKNEVGLPEARRIMQEAADQIEAGTWLTQGQSQPTPIMPATGPSADTARSGVSATLPPLTSNPHQDNLTIARWVDAKAAQFGDNVILSPDEAAFVARYVGGGGMQKYGAKEGDYGAGVLSEYYTPDNIVGIMVALARRHGYTAGPVLEPSCGVGRFLKYFPANEIVVGVEMQRTSYLIAKWLFPTFDIRHMQFEQLFTDARRSLNPTERFKLVIGNPPYGTFSGKYASMEKKQTDAQKVEEYFMLRGLQLLDPGGLLVYIIGCEPANGATPWLRSGDSKVKQRIADIADLVDAYRIPAGVFDFTDVVSEILVFRKR